MPRLTGWKFALFRIVWFFAFALAVGGTLGGIHYGNVWYDSAVRPMAELGLRTSSAADMLGPPIGSEARAAGIVDGLRLVAIDGRALPQGATRIEIAALLDRPEGARVRIRTQSPEGRLREHVLTRSRSHAAEAYAASGMTREQKRLGELIVILAAAVVNIFAAIMLFRRRARDPVAAALSLAFLLLVAGWGPAWDTFYMLGLVKLSVAARAIGYGALFVGIAVFPEGRLETRWRRALIPAISLWVLAVLVDVADPFDVPDNLLVLSAIALLAASVGSLWGRYRRLPMGAARQQIRWALLGFAVGAALGSATLIIDMVGVVNPDGPAGIWLDLLLWIGSSLGFASLALGLLVSLLKYRLYDADAAISRSAGYAVLTLLLAGTFGASAKAIEWFFETSFGGDAGALPGAIGAGLAVVLITPMHNRIHRWTERRFQKALLHLRRDLPDCVGDLRETAGMKELLDELLARVLEGTRAVRAAVVIHGETVAARGGDGAYPLSIPLRISHQETEVGTLLVGPRPDGSAPGKDEREALAEIADPVARALRIVGVREREQAERLGEKEGLRSAIAALGARLDRLEAKAT
ncbi:MAG TPA: hypothetical protein VMG08_11490 [Allosphingosinicella sp.]|nr:hypothetical protein [Allosphingosinicella sp.]